VAASFFLSLFFSVREGSQRRVLPPFLFISSCSNAGEVQVVRAISSPFSPPVRSGLGRKVRDFSHWVYVKRKKVCSRYPSFFLPPPAPASARSFYLLCHTMRRMEIASKSPFLPPFPRRSPQSERSFSPCPFLHLGRRGRSRDVLAVSFFLPPTARLALSGFGPFVPFFFLTPIWSKNTSPTPFLSLPP